MNRVESPRLKRQGIIDLRGRRHSDSLADPGSMPWTGSAAGCTERARCQIQRTAVAAALLLSFMIGSSSGQVLDAPPSIAAALTVKLAAFYKNIDAGGDVTVYVMGSPQVAAELEKGIGTAIGTSKLARVSSGDKVPGQKPSILFVGNQVNLDEAIAYSRAQKILTMTSLPDLVDRGVTLGIGVGNDGKPKVILNLESTIKENITWNPAIMKIARTVR